MEDVPGGIFRFVPRCRQQFDNSLSPNASGGFWL
jgi:hypothetical protein